MLLAIALVTVAAPTPPLPQTMISPAFERLARRTDASCPSRHLRSLTPGDLDDLEERFAARLSAPHRRRLAKADPGFRGCANQEGGLSCPAQHRLAAMERLHLAKTFARFACASPIAN